MPKSTKVLKDFGKQLLYSSKVGEAGEVEWLMAMGSPFLPDWLGATPLHYTAEFGHYHVAKILLKYGIDCNLSSKLGKTSLHIAAQFGNNDVAILLITHGAYINAIDMLEMTALHWAVERNHMNLVLTLLENGADVTAKSKFDQTALDLAKSNNLTSIVHILLKVMPPDMDITLTLPEHVLGITIEPENEVTISSSENIPELESQSGPYIAARGNPHNIQYTHSLLNNNPNTLVNPSNCLSDGLNENSIKNQPGIRIFERSEVKICNQYGEPIEEKEYGIKRLNA